MLCNSISPWLLQVCERTLSEAILHYKIYNFLKKQVWEKCVLVTCYWKLYWFPARLTIAWMAKYQFLQVLGTKPQIFWDLRYSTPIY